MPVRARDLVIEFGIVLVIVLVVAFLGPFGSFEIGGFETRLIYWGAMIFGGYALVRPLMLLAPALTARLELPELAVWLGLVGIAGIPVTLLVWFGGGGSAFPSLANFLRLYPNVLLIGVLVTLVFWVLRQKPVVVEDRSAKARPLKPESADAEATVPRLLERLPIGQRSTVLALEMEDHYVRVHVAQGSVLVLLRMRDAVGEMDGADGMQVHRSWWVARDAVTGHRSDGRNLTLRLKGGLEAPVARSSVEALRAARWLADQG